MTTLLHENLKNALRQYATNPDSNEYKGVLISSAYHIYDKLVTQASKGEIVEGDVYTPLIANFLVKGNLESLQMSETNVDRLNSLVQACSEHEDSRFQYALCASDSETKIR